MNLQQTELYNKTLTHITKHPEEWDQHWPIYGLNSFSGVFMASCFLAHALHFLGDKHGIAGSGAAERVFGLPDEVGFWLWSPNRTLDDFRLFGRTLWAYYTPEENDDVR